MTRTFTCRVVGHHWVFAADGDTLTWGCARGCQVGGSRRYESAEEVNKRLAVLHRGAPRPPLGLLAALGGTVHREPKRRRRDGQGGQ